MADLEINLVTPRGVVAHQAADGLTAPGELGEFELLPGHVPMLSAMRAGVLRYRKGQERGVVAIGPGFAEVDGKDKVVALVQRALPSAKLSGDAADKLLAEATERLKNEKSERGSAESDRDFALAQLEALGRK